MDHSKFTWWTLHDTLRRNQAIYSKIINFKLSSAVTGDRSRPRPPSRLFTLASVRTDFRPVFKVNELSHQRACTSSIVYYTGQKSLLKKKTVEGKIEFCETETFFQLKSCQPYNFYVSVSHFPMLVNRTTNFSVLRWVKIRPIADQTGPTLHCVRVGMQCRARKFVLKKKF